MERNRNYIAYQTDELRISFGAFTVFNYIWKGVEFSIKWGDDDEKLNALDEKLKDHIASKNDKQIIKLARNILENMDEDILSRLIDSAQRRGEQIFKKKYRDWEVSNPLLD